MFPATYTLLLPVMSVCEMLGSGAQAFIRAMVVRCVDL